MPNSAVRCQALAFHLLAYLLLASTAAPSNARAQAALPPPPDSLRAALAANPSGPARVRVLLRVAQAGFDEADSALVISYGVAATHLARQLRNASLEGQATDLLGVYYLWKGDSKPAAPLLHRAEQLLRNGPVVDRAANYYHLGRLYTEWNRAAKARHYYRQSIAWFREAKDRSYEAEVLISFSDYFLLQGQRDSAMYCVTKAARLTHQLGLKGEEAIIQTSIAQILYDQHRLPEAAQYARLAYKLHQQHNVLEYRRATYSVLGHIARAQDSLTVALAHYREALRLARLFHHPLTLHYADIALAMDQMGRADSAVIYQMRAVRFNQRVHQGADASFTMAVLARYYLHQHKLPLATLWAGKALAAQGNRSGQFKTLPLLVLKEIAVARRDYREALRLAERIRSDDSLQQARESKRLAEELRISYETEQAEQRVRLLEKEQQVVGLRRRQELAATTGLGLVGLLLAGGLLRRYRQRQRRREQALRQRLAADLHDDVGGLLTQISIDSALLHTGSSAPEQQKRLERIAETSRQAVRQMSDVVWSIDAQHGSWADVLERMRDHAYEVLSPVGIEIDFAVAPAAAALAVGLQPVQQLYLIYKEALHNIVKHSGARRATVRVNQQANHLELAVRDDGRGHLGGSPLGGRGLNNMRMRAEAVGGTVKYDFGRTEMGFGLFVRLPLR